jgi:chaperonin cofactor prefoldin
MGKRFDAQIEAVKVEIKRLESRIVAIEENLKEIKADLKQIFKPLMPNK